MRTLRQVDLTSGLTRALYSGELVQVETDAGELVGFYEWSENVRRWIASSVGSMLGIDTDAVLATMRGSRNGAQARTTGATVVNAGDGDTWNWDEDFAGPYDADNIGPGLPGGWVRDTSSGSSTLAGDTTGPSAGNTVVKIRGIGVAATAPTLVNNVLVYDGSNYTPAPSPGGTAAGDVTGPIGTNVLARMKGVAVSATAAASGQYIRDSSTAGTLATGQVQFPAIAGTLSTSTDFIRLSSDVNRQWSISAVSAISGGLITATVSGEGIPGNASAATAMRLVNPPAATGGVISFAGSTVDIQMEFAASPGITIPAATLIKLTSGGAASWTVTVGGTTVSGIITVYCSGPSLDTGTSVDLNTPIPSVTTTGAVVTKVAAGTSLKLTADPSVQWTAASDTSIVGGVAAVPVTGPGITLGVAITAPTAQVLAGTCTTAAGIYQFGTVSSAVVGGTDAWAASPITDITGGRILSLKRLPNGDLRKGVYPNDATKNSAPGVNAVIGSMVQGDILEVDDAYYGDTFIVNRDQYPGCIGITIRGKNAIGSGVGPSRFVSNANQPTTPLFVMASTRCKVEGIYFTAINSYVRQSLFEIGKVGTATVTINWITLDNCAFDVPSSIIMDKLVGIGSWNLNTANLENTSLYRCQFRGISGHGLVLGSGQPYTTNCYDTSFFGGGNGLFSGWAARANLYSGNMYFSGCDFQSLQGWIDGGESPTTNINPQSENCKAWYRLTAATFTPHVLEGGRLNGGRFGDPSTYPYSLSSSSEYVTLTGGASLTFKDVRVVTGLVESRAAVVSVGNLSSFTTVGRCILPSREGIKKAGANAAINISPETRFSYQGSVARLESYPTGGLNGPGWTTVYGATQTEAVVPLYEAEDSADDYQVVATASIEAGTPAAGSLRVTEKSKTTSKFTLALEAPPGTGAGVRINYNIIPISQRITAPSQCESLFAHWRAEDAVHSDVAGTERVSSWPSVLGGYTMSQATAGSRLEFVAASANINNLPTVLVNNGFSIQAATAADWTFLHDGLADCTVCVVSYNLADVSNAQLGTNLGNPALLGINIFLPAASSPQISIFNGSGAAIVTAPSALANRMRWTCVQQNALKLRYTSSPQRTWLASIDGVTNSPRGTGAPQSPFGIRGVAVGAWEVAEIIIWKSFIGRGTWERFVNGYLQPKFGGFV